MRAKVLLVAVVLAVGLCFVSGAGYGEVKHSWYEKKTSVMHSRLLEARVTYMMKNPIDFLYIRLYYDPDGRFTEFFPEGVDTKGKICVLVGDNDRGVFSGKSGTALLSQFKRNLEVIYSFIQIVATDMNADIVAVFLTKEEIPLGYFYQGEYHLWEQ